MEFDNQRSTSFDRSKVIEANGNTDVSYNVSRDLRPTITDSQLRNSALMPESIDMVEQLAKEKKQSRQLTLQKIKRYKVLIFLGAFFLSFFSVMRQKYIFLRIDCSNSILNVQYKNYTCAEIQSAFFLASALGYLVAGNLMDNIKRKKEATAIWILILIFVYILQILFSFSEDTIDRQKRVRLMDPKSMILFLYEMSTVFESGLNMICVIVMHNWFKDTYLGIALACCSLSPVLQYIVQLIICNHWNKIESDFVYYQTDDVLVYQTIFVLIFYTVMSCVCYRWFYNNPSEVGLVEEDLGFQRTRLGHYTKLRLPLNYSFIFSARNQNIAYNQSDYDSGSQFISQRKISFESIDYLQEQTKVDVTFVDAFSIIELKYLLASYLIQCIANQLMMHSRFYQSLQTINQLSYYFGCAIGELGVGILVDFGFKSKLWTTLSVINFIVLLLFIITFFANLGSDPNANTDQTIQNDALNSFLSFCYGSIFGARYLYYLMLIPIAISREHARRMAQLNELKDSSTIFDKYVGTIVGCYLAITTAGEQMISITIARTILYLNQGSNTQWVTDILTIIIVILANSLILKPAIMEQKQPETHIESITNQQERPLFENQTEYDRAKILIEQENMLTELYQEEQEDVIVEEYTVIPPGGKQHRK